jgi:hypothetical protein
VVDDLAGSQARLVLGIELRGEDAAVGANREGAILGFVNVGDAARRCGVPVWRAFAARREMIGGRLRAEEKAAQRGIGTDERAASSGRPNRW